MRLSSLSLSLALICASLSALAQTPVTSLSDDWRRVEQLAPHTRIKIAADRKRANCFVDSVNEESLVCSQSFKGSGSTITFPRAEIRKIKLSAKGRSTLGGLGLGAAIGAGASGGIAVGINNSQNPGGSFVSSGEAFGVGAAVGGVIGLGIGAGIGHSTDWLAGPVIYQRK